MKFTFKLNKFVLFALVVSLLSLFLLGYKLFYLAPEMVRDAEIAERSVLFALNEDLQEENDLLSPEGGENKALLSPVLQDDNSPVISLLIEGLDAAKIPREFFNLPEEITFGISTNVTNNNIKSLISQKRNVLLNLPLEHEDLITQSEETLLSNNAEDENSKLLNNFLSALDAKEGVYSIPEEKFTETISESEFLLQKLKEKDVLYLCGKADKSAIIYQIADKMSFHVLANDVILDEVIEPSLITANLAKLENIAIKNGSAIAIMSSYPLTLEILQNWLPTLENKGIKILPIKTLYKITKQRKELKNQELIQ